MIDEPTVRDARPGTFELARYFFRLGATGFGGPIALASYMQRDLVERRQWVSQAEYLEGLAAAQTLPGPLAAQLAMWLGFVCRGTRGATSAGLAFILPPFVLVSIAAAAYVSLAGSTVVQTLFYGVGPAVIALILRGAWKLMRVSLRDDRRMYVVFAVVAAITFIARAEVAVLFIAAGLLGALLYAGPRGVATRLAAVLPLHTQLLAGVVGSVDLPVLLTLGLFFLKAGAFTFGSGLAIVPFLQEGIVIEHQWLTQREFLDAVAIGMISPGPVVITAVFVGYLIAALPGAAVAAVGVFLPPYLMVVLLAPVIRRYRDHAVVRGFTKGASAAAAGAIVGAAAVIARQVLVDVVTVSIFAVALVALARLRLSEPIVVGLAAVAGLVLAALRSMPLG